MHALQTALGKRFHIRDDLRQWMAWSHQPLPPLPPHRELIAAADLEDPLQDGRRPLAHQRSGARWLLARRGAVLADEMGLGKTLTALLAARALARCASLRVLVVAPVGLHAHWQREADAVAQVVQLVSWARLPAELPEVGTLLWWMKPTSPRPCRQDERSTARLARHPRLRAI